MPYAPADPLALSKQLRTLWGALCAGVVLLSGVMGWLAATEPDAPLGDAAQAVFFGVAALNLLAMVGALAVMRRLEDGTASAPDAVQQRAILALAMLEVGAFAAAIAAFLTGDLFTLAFGASMLGFAFVFWPTEARVARWLGAA